MSILWQRIRSSFTAYWLLLTLFAVPIVSPLLNWWQVACTHDDHLHRFRVAALRHAWEQGLFFSRWMPDLAFGYGFPFLIYREPLPLYLILIPHWLGLPLSAATNLFYLICIVLGAGFMFLWVRDVLGDAAAFISALVYLTTPYILIDVYIRGNSVESFALALLPLLCWAGQRYVVRGAYSVLRNGNESSNTQHATRSTLYFLLTTLAFAVLGLSHNISLLIFTPMFLIYLLLVGWLHQLDWRMVLLRSGLVLGLGMGLTIFHTATAVLEMGQVTLSQSVSTRNNDFHYNFTSLAEILAPVTIHDTTLLNAPLLFRLGWVPLGLALIGLALGFRHKDRVKRGHIALMGLFAAAFLFMSSSFSLFIWETVPLIDFIQFPWRFIGRAALPIAFLAGVPFTHLRLPIADLRLPSRSSFTIHQSPVTIIFWLLTTVLLVLETLPNLYPKHCTELPYPTINDLHQYEHETELVGVDPEGSYFPVTVHERPTGSRLEADYQAGQTPQRWELPSDVVVHEVEYGNNRGRVHLTSSAAFTAHYLTFAFPGWYAKIDGQAIPITPSDPEGLISFSVPAGEHTLAVRWGWTTQRAILAGLSVLAGLGIVGFTIYDLRFAIGVPNNTHHAPRTTFSPPPAAILIPLALIALKFLVIDRIDTPFRRAAAPQVQHAVGLTVTDLELVGYNLSHETIPSGESFAIDMAWYTHQSPGVNLQSSILLVGADGLIWSEKELFRTRPYENAPGTFFWLPGQWAWDSWDVTVLAGTPPGQYELVLTMFELDTLRPRTLISSSGEPLGPSAVIGQIQVHTPDEPVTVRPQYPTQQTIAGLNLLGYNLDRTEARPGDTMLVTLFWENPEPTSPFTIHNSPFTIDLVDAAGQVAQRWDIPPVREDYPPIQWQPGERLRGQLPLRFAAALGSGTYTLQLEGFPLGQIQLTAPERTLIEPIYESVLDVSFDEAITLLGYSQLVVNSQQLAVTLIWQTRVELTTGYRVFVHLVNEEGAIVTQTDGEPANWSRPTTGWMPGEYIVDNHTLMLPENLPAGNYTLRLGLYNPDNGQRLPTSTGDAVNIPVQLP